jgi:molecular chaperone HtpG
MNQQAEPERYDFQAEASQVLQLVIHSLYSHPEIFLRELVSNASDALDKLKYRALTEHELSRAEAPLEIRIDADPKAGTVVIEDFGIGMTKEELKTHLGTVAHSGTRAFLAAAKSGASSAPELIGQFGVGFYSAFLVARSVRVESRAAGASESWAWASEEAKGFAIEPGKREVHGTRITLWPKEDCREYGEPWRLRGLVARYSDFVSHPVKLLTPAPTEAADKGEATLAYEQVNQGKALWLRSKEEITDAEYEEFYKHTSHDLEGPLARTHFQVEGTQMFTGLLFVPGRPPFDLWNVQHRRGVRLYVKRVFIMDQCEELVPTWLRFVRGVIDSQDLPLNVSREILQSSSATRFIAKQVVKKTLDLLDSLAADRPDEYTTFWTTFGAVLKEGLHASPAERERIAKLVRYKSTCGDGWTSLADYVARMPQAQPAIYYAIGDSEKAAAASPHLEAVRQRGWEVLLMTDPIDEWATQALGEYQTKPLTSVMQADLKLDPAAGEKPADESNDRINHPGLDALLTRAKAVLGEHVAEVRVSTRLTESPACLVVPEGGMHAPLERLMRAHRPEAAVERAILELNPSHPLVLSLAGVHAKAADSAEVTAWIQTLYDAACLAEGRVLEDPSRLSKRLAELLTQAAGDALAATLATTREAEA